MKNYYNKKKIKNKFIKSLLNLYKLYKFNFTYNVIKKNPLTKKNYLKNVFIKNLFSKKKKFKKKFFKNKKFKKKIFKNKKFENKSIENSSNDNNKLIIRNLFEYSYRKEQMRNKKIKEFIYIFKHKYNKILNIKKRFNYNKYRIKYYKDILQDGNWHKLTKKFFFINLFLKNFLIYFLKKVFFIDKHIVINFFESSHDLLSKNPTGLKITILARLAAQYRIGHFIYLLKRKLQSIKNVVGFKIQVVGRYQKKLRNRKIEVNYGNISSNNKNSPLSFKNFLVIYKFGTCGVRIRYLRNSYNYEII